MNEYYYCIHPCRGNYAEAIGNYEKGLKVDASDSDPELVNHRKLCQHGIARTSIKNGEYRKGVIIHQRSEPQSFERKD